MDEIGNNEMEIVVDLFGRDIEFPYERWNHACQQHPEIESQKSKVKETIENPDFIKISFPINPSDFIISIIAISFMANTFL